MNDRHVVAAVLAWLRRTWPALGWMLRPDGPERFRCSFQADHFAGSCLFGRRELRDCLGPRGGLTDKGKCFVSESARHSGAPI